MMQIEQEAKLIETVGDRRSKYPYFEIQQYFNQLVNHKIFDSELLLKLKKKAKESLNKI